MLFKDKRVLDFIVIWGLTIAWVYFEQTYLRDPLYELSI